jgi:hypothetical protein
MPKTETAGSFSLSTLLPHFDSMIFAAQNHYFSLPEK